MDFESRNLVEAIEDGRIVRVSEEYAKGEGLMILRRSGQEIFSSENKDLNDEEKLGFDDFRRPLKKVNDQVSNELVSNFQWEIMRARRAKNLTRKNLADAVEIKESQLKLIENGVLEQNDFVIINKIQRFLGINIRKDRKDFGQDMRKLVEKSNFDKKNDLEEKKISDDKLNFKGNEIEIVGDDANFKNRL